MGRKREERGENENEKENSILTEHACSGTTLSGDAMVTKFLARINKLYGNTAMEATEVDHWVLVASKAGLDVAANLSKLDNTLSLRNFLVGAQLSLADIVMAATTHGVATDKYPNVTRWLKACQAVQALLAAQEEAGAHKVVKAKAVDQGRFVELVGAEMGKVCTRFPPEASGYLHIGHAKVSSGAGIEPPRSCIHCSLLTLRCFRRHC